MQKREWGRPAMNTGKAWSEMDDEDLRNSTKSGMPIGELAVFLQRNRTEITRRQELLKIAASARLQSGTQR